MQKNIQQQIVSYLNSKGGIIFIGLEKKNHKIIPYITEIP